MFEYLRVPPGPAQFRFGVPLCPLGTKSPLHLTTVLLAFEPSLCWSKITVLRRRTAVAKDGNSSGEQQQHAAAPAPAPANEQRKKAKKISQNPVAELLNQIMRSNPLLHNNGVLFKNFKPTELNKNGGRTVETTAEKVPQRNRYRLECV